MADASAIELRLAVYSNMEEMEMMTRENRQQINDDDRNGQPAAAPAGALCPLSDAELEYVAGGGGKIGASSNPVED